MTVKTPTPQQLGRRIRNLRQDRGLSQDDLARPDYTAAYISHIEHGKRRASQEVLAHVATRLGLTVDQLVTGRDPDEDLRLEIETQEAVAQIHGGESARALKILERVRKRALETKNVRVAELAGAAIGLALYRLGKIEQSLAAYENVLSEIGEGGPERRTSAVVGMARCLFHSGEARDAIHLLESHLIDLERRDPPDPGCLVEVYAALIPAYFESGLIERASDVASKGWKLAPSIDDVDQRACLYVNRAQLLLTQGEPREALASLSLAEDLYRQLGWQAEAAKVILARSYVVTEQGDLQEAERLINAALEVASVDRADEIRALTRLAMIRRLLGDPQEGLELAGRARKRAARSFAGSRAEAIREQGMCFYELGDHGSALESWREALKLFGQTSDHEETARTARMIGDRLSEMGDSEGALQAYREGLGAVTELK